MSFVHLHVHSEYSLLDGFSNLKKLVRRAQEMEMPALALTDHGTMFGAISFYKAATAAGVKPIIGLEAYLAARTMKDRDPKLDKKSSHLLLLAENETGYRNLLQIASAAQLDGFYYYPRIDKEYLADHSEGLICTSGCLSAEIPRALMRGDVAGARRKLDWYYEVFGPDHFYLELQNHEIERLDEVNNQLLGLGNRYNARFVATNDVHYVDPEDGRLQDILLAIQTSCVLTDPNRMRMSDNSYYLRSPVEMARIFEEVPDAVANTLRIAERCELDLGFKGYRLPNFEVPESYTPQGYLRELCEKGLARKYGDRAADPTVQGRLDYELQIINEMGFDTYFLIVWDLCRFAQEQEIWYNARGSAAGSIVAYTLDITMVDPIEHGLIFERFLNPGRVSMPDIDLDFRDDLRWKMLEYCARRYGEDKVAQIITFGTLKARAAVRDVGRVMDIPLNEVDRIAKYIPNIPGKPVSIQEALEKVPEFQQAYQSSEYIRELLDTAKDMEGVVRNAGTHAAGVIITDKPIVEYIPLHRPTGNAVADSPIKTVTQFEMEIVDSLGLLKVDFLGLATLTIMARACKLIKQRHNVDYSLANIPVDDPETFELLGRGETAGVFQVEGTGMRRYLVQMKPRNLDHVVAMVALFRPGPMEFIPTYIKRMHEEEEVTYLDPSLEPIFQETYGIPVYQEQIMRAAVDLAGYTASEADDLRKAIAKKIKAKLMKHRKKFVAGAEAREIDQQVADKIFSDWEEFARYGFNKAHAADYGVIAVQTAFLKTHYPVEYMAALLSVSKNDSDKVAFYVGDCRRIGLEVLPPDVNASEWDFVIEDRPEAEPAIRFGMGAIKNVGYGPVEVILKDRGEEPFRDLSDFSRRVDLRVVGKRALECLIKVGALDSFGSRAVLLASMDQIHAISASHFRAKESGQLSFFGAQTGLPAQITLTGMGARGSQRDQLNWEKDLLGLYVSDHPLNPYMEDLKNTITHFSSQLSDAADRERVRVAGMVAQVRPHMTRTGKPMGFAQLEDLQGTIELVVFPNTWKKYGHLLEYDRVVVIDGKVDSQDAGTKLLVDSITTDFKDLAPANPGPAAAGVAGGGNGKKGYAQDGGPETRTATSPAPLATPPAENEFVDDSVLLSDSPESPPPPEAFPRAWEQESEGVYAPKPAPRAKQPDPQPVEIDSAGNGSGEESEHPKSSQSEPAPDTAGQAQDPPEPPEAVAGTSEPAAKRLDNEGESATREGESAQTTVAPIASGAAAPSTSIPAQKEPQGSDYPPAEPFGLREIDESSHKDQPRKMITIILRSSGDRTRDHLQLRRIHGTLISYPGHDQFAFYMVEAGRSYVIEFPNFSTGVCEALLTSLRRLVGQENLRVEEITYQ